jgi:hypothetical protein
MLTLKDLKKKQKLYLTISAVMVISGLLLSLLYRPLVYRNSWNDFGLADTIGSLVSVIAFCFFIWGFKDYSLKNKYLQIILVTFVYAVLWESVGYFNIYGTFDLKDMIAAVISGILTLVFMLLIERNYQKNTSK